MDNRTSFRVVVLLLIAACAYAGVALVRNNRVEHLHLNATNALDTAKVYRTAVSTGLDSFAYADTLVINDTTVVTYTSPPTVRRVAVAASIDTTKTDTLHVDLGTNKTGVAYVVANLAWTRAQYIDTIVARFNAVTTLADTVLAEDSVTYILLRSKIAQIQLEGDARWTLDVTNASANMVEGDSTFTTKAIAIAGIVAAINATAALADSLTAANSGDTAYTVTGRKGYNFLLSPKDTTQDTTVVTAAVARVVSVTDTFFLERVAGDDRSFTSLNILVVLALPDDTLHGIGDSSYGYLYLKNGRDSTLFAWAAAADSSALPCSLSFSFPDAAAADTVFKQGLYLVAKVTDTFSDTPSIYMIEYDINMDYTLKASR